MQANSITTESIQKQVADSARTVAGLSERAGLIQAMCEAIVGCLKGGGKILTAGNGGSGAEAMHMAEELTGRFRHNRVSLPGIALIADGTTLTCIGNDFGFECVFSRQIEGLGRKGDVLVLFTTSGNSPNLLAAAAAARKQGLTTISLSGRNGGKLAGQCALELIVPGTGSERIQEAHQVVMHILLDAVEKAFPAAGGEVRT